MALPGGVGPTLSQQGTNWFYRSIGYNNSQNSSNYNNNNHEGEEEATSSQPSPYHHPHDQQKRERSGSLLLLDKQQIANEIAAAAAAEATTTSVATITTQPVTTKEKVENDASSDSKMVIRTADVLCGRGKTSFNHVGNKRFREDVSNALNDFRRAETRFEKSRIVRTLVDRIQRDGGRFLKKRNQTGDWYELTLAQSKEKVAHAIRDAANLHEATSRKKKRDSGPKRFSFSGINYFAETTATAKNEPPLYGAADTRTAGLYRDTYHTNHYSDEYSFGGSTNASGAVDNKRRSSAGSYCYNSDQDTPSPPRKRQRRVIASPLSLPAVYHHNNTAHDAFSLESSTANTATVLPMTTITTTLADTTTTTPCSFWPRRWQQSPIRVLTAAPTTTTTPRTSSPSPHYTNGDMSVVATLPVTLKRSPILQPPLPTPLPQQQHHHHHHHHPYQPRHSYDPLLHYDDPPEFRHPSYFPEEERRHHPGRVTVGYGRHHRDAARDDASPPSSWYPAFAV